MEKQRIFSVKPIRYLVFSFTISFSVFFLCFFSTWIFKPNSSVAHTLGVSSNSLTVQSLKEFNSSSSGFVLKNPIPMGRNLKGGQDSSQIHGNSSSGNSLSVDGFNVSFSSKESNLDVSRELSDGIATVDSVNSEKSHEEIQELNDVTNTSNVGVENFKKEDISSNVLNDSEHSLIRNNVELKNKVDVPNDIEHSLIGNRDEPNNKVDCDVTKGQWVYDESYPLYTNITCPFIDEGFSCESNGRLDNEYMRWRWQPHDCDVPRFNATKMLELIRGKRLVFVGDSINRNQWESMLCLLMGAVKDPKKVYEARGRKITKERNNYSFKFEDYKCTVEFYVSHFLVHESKARIGKKRTQTLRIDTIDKGSSRWRGADILVFNTAHWWNHHKTKAGINYYQEGDQVHPHLDVTKAFQRALLTWASWVDKNINQHKTHVFFRSSAPSHFSGGLWNTGGHCREAFRPVNETTFTSIYPERNLVVEEILRQMKTLVTFLNITRLSDYRPDAHPSMYGRKSVNPGVQDCSHWCLPGVPDNWNELLYYYMQSRTKASFVQ